MSCVAQVTSTSLRCCVWLLRFPLPALRANIRSITNSLVVLLNNYASPGAARTNTDNFELIVTCFKVRPRLASVPHSVLPCAPDSEANSRHLVLHLLHLRTQIHHENSSHGVETGLRFFLGHRR